MRIIVLVRDNRHPSDAQQFKEAAKGSNVEVFGDGNKSIKWLLENDNALQKSLEGEDVLVIILTHGQNIEVSDEKERVLHASGGYRSTSHFIGAIPKNIQHIIEFSCMIGTHDRPYLKRNLGERSGDIVNESEYVKAVNNRVISSAGDSKYPSLSVENVKRIIKLIEIHKKHPEWNQNQLIIYDALMNPVAQYISNNSGNVAVSGVTYRSNIIKLPRFLEHLKGEVKMPNVEDEKDEKKEPAFTDQFIYDFLNRKIEKLLEIFPDEADFIHELTLDETFRREFYNHFLIKAPHLYADRDAADVIDALIKIGVDVNIRELGFASPFLIACEKLQIENIRLFLKGGADPNSTYKNGDTALIDACVKHYSDEEQSRKNILMVQILLKSDELELNKKDAKGKFPFDLAFRSDNKEIAKLIIQDPRIDLKAQLDVAIAAGDFEKIKFIFDHGIFKVSANQNETVETKNNDKIPQILDAKLLVENPAKFKEECYKILAEKSVDYQFDYINLLTQNCNKQSMLRNFDEKLLALGSIPGCPSEDFIKSMDKKISIPQKTKLDRNPNARKAEILSLFKAKMLAKYQKMNADPNPEKPKATAIVTSETLEKS